MNKHHDSCGVFSVRPSFQKCTCGASAADAFEAELRALLAKYNARLIVDCYEWVNVAIEGSIFDLCDNTGDFDAKETP